MPPPLFQAEICRPFCAFFRPGVKEELVCRAAALVTALLRQGVLAQADFPDPAGKEPGVWLSGTPLPEEYVCGSCSFAPDGCDFFVQPRSPAVEPCGGYILLSLLVAQGTLSPLLLAPAARSLDDVA